MLPPWINRATVGRCFTALLCLFAVPAQATTKDDLVDAVAAGAKLTKADAGRTVDAVLQGIGETLAGGAGTTGQRVALSGFGTVFTAQDIPADSATCTTVTTVEFQPANALTRLINPIAMDKGLRFRVTAVADAADGVLVTGVVTAGTVAVGDRVTIEGTPKTPTIDFVEVAGMSVDGTAILEAHQGQGITLALRGIEKKQIKRGMVIIKRELPQDPGPVLSPCFPYALDEEIAARAASAIGLRYEYVLQALQVLKDAIATSLADGNTVDLAGFGVFYVAGEQVLSQTDAGTDLSLAKTKKVKFKAGADLAGTVNK